MARNKFTEATNTSVYWINPSKAVQGKTSEEVSSKRKSSFEHLIIFVCPAYNSDTKEPDKRKEVLICWVHWFSKAYRLPDSNTNIIVVSGNVDSRIQSGI